MKSSIVEFIWVTTKNNSPITLKTILYVEHFRLVTVFILNFYDDVPLPNVYKNLVSIF